MTRLHRHLSKRVEKAVYDFGLIQPGDRIAVAVSGGSDSLALLILLENEKIKQQNRIELIPLHVDMGFPEDSPRNSEVLAEFLSQRGYSVHVERTNIGPLAHSDFNRKNPCFLCTRYRRQCIYQLAEQHCCNKIAYGHHKDDIIETLLINIFFGREISTMMPKQSVFRGKFHIIRPLIYIEEVLLKKFALEQHFPLLNNPCTTSEVSKRKYIKDWLNRLENENKGLKENIFKALFHVKVDYLPQRLFSSKGKKR